MKMAILKDKSKDTTKEAWIGVVQKLFIELLQDMDLLLYKVTNMV